MTSSTTSPSPYATYLDHLRRGELAYQFSPTAQRAVFFPRVVSPHDVDETLEWRVSQGLGTVYSATTLHGRDGAYNVALVDCDEGFRLMTRIEQCALEDIRIGMRVRFSVHAPPAETDEDLCPVFLPVEPA